MDHPPHSSLGPDAGAAHPAICLNMIVRNEAHIVEEGLETVAPYISSWVIVDTGSDDGTQEVIRTKMAALGIPGELHDRPWRNFGENRSEAITLAKGHADYIWVMDADDIVVGTPDFSGLDADVYAMRISDGLTYWRRQLFRDGLPWRYIGVVHEYADCTDPFTEKRLDGDYHIASRRLGARNNDPQKYARDRDLLLAEVEQHPDNERAVFYLAESYYNLGDFENARLWLVRRCEMGGWAEEVYYSMWQVARTMSHLGAAWSDIQDAYLRAWEFRPTRAEPLYAIAARYRADERFHLGRLFAERAAAIPLPDEDILFVDAAVYQWRAADELAICASWTGGHEQAFMLCRRLLARSDVPEPERCRIAANRDVSAPAMMQAASTYPEGLAHSIITGDRDAEVTVSLITDRDRDSVERALNSFLHCCLDIQRVGRFLLLDTGLHPHDRAAVRARYPFLEFLQSESVPDELAALQRIKEQLGDRRWLHLGRGWQFFAPEFLVTRLTAVLDAEPGVIQVGLNLDDAAGLTGRCAPEDSVRRTTDSGRYVLATSATTGPAMFDIARLDRVSGNGPKTATLDEVLCVRAR